MRGPETLSSLGPHFRSFSKMDSPSSMSIGSQGSIWRMATRATFQFFGNRADHVPVTPTVGAGGF